MENYCGKSHLLFIRSYVNQRWLYIKRKYMYLPTLQGYINQMLHVTDKTLKMLCRILYKYHTIFIVHT